MVLYIIDERRAMEIATGFVQQYHSLVRTEKPIARDGIWFVKVISSSPTHKEFEIKVNAKTGHVISF